MVASPRAAAIARAGVRGDIRSHAQQTRGSEPVEDIVKKKRPADHKTLDPEALTAAVAGFLACHVLTLRFLVQEGIVDKDRLVPYLESAMEEMRPGLADPRSLFVLSQIVDALRPRAAEPGLQ